MATFLYFAKGWKQPINSKLAAEWGVGHAFDNEPTDADCQHPDLGHGRLFANLSQLDGEPLVARGLPRQNWRLCVPAVEHNRPEIHVGYWVDHKPTPANLARDGLLPGHEVVLGDDQPWTAPMAIQWLGLGTHSCQLPRGADYDPVAQAWGPGAIDPRYEPLWEIATRFDAWMRGINQQARQAVAEAGGAVAAEDEIELTLTKADGLRDAVAALAFNYRVGPVEADALGWFSRDHELSLKVLESLVDWPSLLGMLKKKAEAVTGDS